jgi:hypothetical protein
MTKRLLVLIIALIFAGCTQQKAHGTVEYLGTYKGPGAIDGAVIGPGPAPGTQRLYLAYMYVNRTVDLVSVDPTTGKWQVYENPAKSEYGAVMILGPDGNVYLGTRPHAHLYQFSPRTGTYKDLGQPATGEAYIWGLTVAADGKILRMHLSLIQACSLRSVFRQTGGPGSHGSEGAVRQIDRREQKLLCL